MINALINYQNADAKLREIEKTLAGSEERKKAMNAKKYIDGVEENVSKLDVRAAELAAAYERATEDQIKLKEQEEELARAIEELGDENAASYLFKKAEELVAKVRTLGEKINKISDEVQTVMKDYATIKNTTKAAQTQYKENAAKYNALKESLKAEKDSIEKELEKLKKEVDPALMARYEKKRAGKIYPILYEAKGNVCGACRMELPASELAKLKRGEVIDCDQCGRMLYQEQK